jgi:hypothetical protein
MERPFLTKLQMGGGLSTDIIVESHGDEWLIKGQCLLKKGQISAGKAFSLKGIDLDLPLWLKSQSRRDSPTPIKGTLSIQSLEVPLLPVQPLSLELSAVPNVLTIGSGTALEVPGGEALMGPLVVDGKNLSRPHIDTSVTLRGVEIQPLLSGVWSRPIMGTINGKLDRIQILEGVITTRGEVRVNTFDGEILLSGLGAAGIFTSAPLLTCNTRLKDLNLEAMTTGTPFGKIEGVLEGHINDLEIAYGQPQRFDLLLETVKKPGVSQKISVKAVDNIARIGGGQSPFMGAAGVFVSFFREFPYRKIGIRASLENDVFRINGTIREGDREYLIKRGGFSGVNVVNQNPDNRISFKDMRKRMKRITATGGGPVIK